MVAVIQGDRRTFYQLLINTLLVSVINFTVWFAITFYVYLQTRSVFATGVVSGIFLVLTALTGIWFGSLVDHHAKKTMMQVSAGASLTLYTAAFAIYRWVETPTQRWAKPRLAAAIDQIRVQSTTSSPTAATAKGRAPSPERPSA